MEQARIQEFLNHWDPNQKLIKSHPMTPDASSRSYYRLELESSPGSVVLMVYDGVQPAEIGGNNHVCADEAYVLLTEFLTKEEIAVPKIYSDQRKDAALIIEDVGDVHLADTLKRNSEEILSFYKKAIDELVVLQNIKKESNCFACKRSFNKNIYEKEISEFEEFLLQAENPIVKTAFEKLVEEILELPTAFSHRDYHSWNLLIDKRNQIRIIDFQDALIAPRAYDLASLLNDRDTDSMLGEENLKALIDYFITKQSLDSSFFNEYYRVLLQRDLKVAGRFHKLAKAGKKQYLKWVPGTMKRIGRSLKWLSKSNEIYGQALKELVEKFQDISDGART